MPDSKTAVTALLLLFCFAVSSAAYLSLGTPHASEKNQARHATHKNGISVEDWRRIANLR